MYEICEKNTSKEKYEKLRNQLFKMKEITETALGKGLSASVKWQHCLTKEHLGNQKEHMKAKVPPYLKLFLTL